MKHYLVKISSFFFLVLLLASNITSLHIYFHEQELSHCLNDDNHNNDENEEEAPCDICLVAFNLTNLDYNNSLEFSFKSFIQIQQIPEKILLGYVETLHKQRYFNKNKNKAPPYLA